MSFSPTFEANPVYLQQEQMPPFWHFIFNETLVNGKGFQKKQRYVLP
jgi:hypothetical protein